MPYYITDKSPECEGWATVKEDGEVMGCHTTKDAAIAQGVAIAQAEGSTFEGERSLEELLEDAPGGGLPDNYRPATSDDVPEGRACGNCIFFNEERLNEKGEAWCEWWEAYAAGGFYCNAWQDGEARPYHDEDEEKRVAPDAVEVGDYVSWDSAGGRARGRITRIVREGRLEVPDTDFTLNADPDNPAALIRVYRPVRDGWEPRGPIVGHRFATLTKIDPLPEPSPEEAERRQVDLSPPGYMRASARRGLAWHREGLSGDGLVPRTVREATAMAAGNMTADKWTRTAAWIARHLGDLDAPAAQPDHPSYPSPGVVAMALWGGGVNKRQANRALEYARGVVDRMAEENEGRAKGEAVTKLETRINLSEFEVRETGDGMTFTGYAAVFNSPSEPLPFIERIAPGAFRRSLKDRADIKLLWNHDVGEILASTRSGTLRLYEDEKGLRVEAELANTQRGRDTAELVRTGRVDSMSFGFTVPPGGDQWSEDGSERTVKSVRLFEVSIVAFPAFSATAGGTAVRALDRVATRAEVDVDDLADALLKIENGEDITSDDRQLVEKVLDELYPVSDETDTVEAGDEDLSAELLALKKAKLKLLGGL